MGYVVEDVVAFKLTTLMPAMGHGTVGNVSPTRGDDGVYRGSAVFSMSGDWVMTLEVSRAGEAVGKLELSYPL